MEPTPTQNNNMVPPAEGTMPQEINPTSQVVPPAPDTTSQITPLPPEKPKNRKRSIIILSVIVGILLITAGIFAFLYFSNNSNGDEPEQESSEETQEEIVEEPEEVEITDQLLKNDLDEKIAILYDSTDTGPLIVTRGLRYGTSLYKTGTLNDITKLIYIANSVKPDHVITIEEEDSAIAEQGYTGENAQAFRNQLAEGYNADTLAQKYFRVFGQELEHGAVNGQQSCPGIYYNREYNFYYDPFMGCGGTGPETGYVYKNKYTTDGDHAYVYASVATFAGDEKKVYCDYLDYNEDASTKPAVYGEYNEVTDFTLDDSNYQDFAQYRFVFTKADDGTYYFEKVEKVNS